MRILMITQELSYASSNLSVAHDWAGALAARVSRLFVGAAGVGPFDLPANVTVTSFGKESGASKWQIGLNMAREIASRVLPRQVDLVFVHMVPKHALVAAPFCKLSGVPLSLWYTSHGKTGELRLAHRLVDAAITASADSYPLNGPRVVAIGHGIDTSRFAPTAEPSADPPTILLATRITPLKQVHLAIEALDRPPLRDHPARPVLEIAGEPFRESDRDYMRRLRSMAVELGIQDRVRFLGEVRGDKMPALLARASAAVSLRQYAALDKNGLEALAAGVPVVSNNPSYRPVFGRFEGDLYVEGADPLAIARALAALLDDRDRRNRIGVELREYVVRVHGLEGFAGRLVAIFEAVCRGVPPESWPAPAAV